MENNLDRLLMTGDILKRYPVGRTKLYSLLSEGSLKSIRWGKKYLVREGDLELWLEANEHVPGATGERRG